MTKTFRIHIAGMTCGHCEAAVRVALGEVPGVTRVLEVDRNRQLATVEADPAAPPSPRALEDAVTEEGYQARVQA